MDGLTIFSVVVHSLTNSIGILANALLVYLILTKTPSVLRTYSVLLLNFAFADLLTCLAALFVMERHIPSGLTLAYISHGPCKFLGPSACYVGYSIMLHLYEHSLNSLALSFAYRYYVLEHPTPQTKNVIIVVVLLFCVSLVPMITFCLVQSDPVKMRELVHEKHPTYDLRNVTITGNAFILEFWTLFTILYVCLSWIPLYALIIYVRHKIHQKLSSCNLSGNTRDMHKQLMKVLSIQALLPGFCGGGVISYAIGQFIYQHPVFEEATFIIVGFMPVIAPFVSIYFFGPYRRAVSAVVHPTTSYAYNPNAVRYHPTTTNAGQSQ